MSNLKKYGKNSIFCILKDEDFGTDPHPDPLVRGMDPRIRIRTKMSWIWNIAGRERITGPAVKNKPVQATDRTLLLGPFSVSF
jgi:hypothetical protein